MNLFQGDSSKAKIIVLATSHRFQGARVFKAVDDPCYRALISQLIRENAINFVFEEASGFAPTYAQQIVESSKEIDYLDIDPAARHRPQYGLSKQTGQMFPVEPSSGSCTAHEFFVADHAARETLWLERVVERHFQSALVIVGFAHGLSFSFRLRDAGYDVRCLSYYKEDKLCGHTT